jgi:hypothetical protein
LHEVERIFDRGASIGQIKQRFIRNLAPLGFKQLQAAGRTSLRAIAAGLNEAGVPTARGGEWSSVQVMRILERLDPFRCEEQAAA